MFELDKLVRKNITNLKPYSSARKDFTGKEGVFLDANENPFGSLNRYPDPLQNELKQKLSALKSVAVDNIFIGNGSDEVIDLAFRIFCNPGKDKALTFFPTYGMYEVSASINDVELIQLPLNSNFQIDFNSFLSYIKDVNIKMVFICSPNNPTANIIKDIEKVLDNFNGIVIVDEAYIDFSEAYSLISKIDKYPNLIVSQTLSKAWAMASIRVGIAYANKSIIDYYNNVKPPYNISQLNQKAAISAIDDIKEYETRKKLIISEKKKLEVELEKINCITKIYPSDANFILVETTDASLVYSKLVEQKIIVRNRSSMVNNTVRITVGSPEENIKLLESLKRI